MKEKPSAIPHPPASAAKDDSLGKRLARLKRHLVKTLTGRPDPVLEAQVQDQAFWSSVLTREKEQECPAPYFRKLAFTLRRSHDLAAAEDICARGVRLHPLDLPLAIEHAEIARAAKDQPARMARWQRVLDLAGDMTPLSAFRNLADCHRTGGNFDLAESIVRRGLELHPGDFSLMEKLAGILATSSSSTKALAALRSLIDAHPDQDLAPIYLQMSSVLADEGLLLRATAAVREGLTSYPDSAGLQNRLAELSYLQETPSKPQTDHGSQQHLKFLDQGTLCFSVGHSVFRQHVPAMLGFARTIAPPDVPRRLPEVDVFAVWGAPSAHHPIIRELAAAEAKPLLCLESGFISSPQIEGKDHPVHSVIVCPESVYFDTTQPSYLENRLNSNDYSLTDEQRLRAETCIASIVSNCISKFNHAPRIDLRPRFPADGTRRILLVDQRKGGGSIHWSLGGPATFERMMETALARQDHEILLKLHPEVISGRFESSLLPWLPDPLPSNVTLIDFDVNPFDLFDVVDEVFVCTSQLGFEAVMAGKQVHCFAAPFYAGWGLTVDRMIVPRRKSKRTLSEVFHLFYIEHSRYFVPDKGTADLEHLIAYLVEQRISEPAEQNDSSGDDPQPADISIIPAPAPIKNNQLNILIIVHCGRLGASGRYLQNLAGSLSRLGCRMMVLAEGPCPPLDNGVPWRSIEFEGTRLSHSLREEIVAFAPDIVYESGVRSRAQRAALEVMILTNSRLAMQSEDDDVQAYETQHGKSAAQAMSMIDKPVLNSDDIAGFFQLNNWRHTLNVAFNPGFDYWIEPVVRVLCYRLASLHTAIWHPFEKRLADQYGVPTLVVPPVSSNGDFQRIPLSTEERSSILARHGIDETRTVFFLGGALYPFSNEYSVFLTAINLAFEKTGKQIALVICSGAGRPKLPIDSMARERLHPQISFTNLGKVNDIGYTEMLKASDIVCSPGIPDTFNKFRLPSRLVKAMAMAKPILTCRCGFGESLENGINAFLTDGDDPIGWADAIAECLDSTKREFVGKNGRLFAEKHFNSDRVAAELKKKFDTMMEEPPRGLGDGILHGAADPPPVDSSQMRSMAKAFSRDRYRSSMQDAIHLIKLLAGELGTVLHIGAGKCGELENYCRLGAKRITLVEPLPELAAFLRKFEGHHGKIQVKQVAVSGESGVRHAQVFKNIRPDADDREEMCLLKPTALPGLRSSLDVLRTGNVETHTIAEVCEDLQFSGRNDLLVLELQGLEIEALKATPQILIQRFEWIAASVSEVPLFENGATSSVVSNILKEFGYERIPSVQNFSGPQVAALFRKRPSNEN